MIFRVILFALATAAVIGGLAYWLKCLCLCDYENGFGGARRVLVLQTKK